MTKGWDLVKLVKGRNSLKVRGMAPVFGVCGDFVVIVKRGCTIIRVSRLRFSNLD